MTRTRNQQRGALLLGIVGLALLTPAPLPGQATVTLKGHTHWVSSVCFSPDGKRIVSGSGAWAEQDGECTAGELKVWNVQTGQEALALQGHNSAVYSVAF